MELRTKPIKALALLVVMNVIAWPAVRGQGGRSDEAIQSFWKSFKTAIVSGNRQVAANLSSFPVDMSYGIRKIRTKPEFLRRYRQIFNEQTNAAACFANKEPEIETAKPTRASVACPNEAGDDVVIYHFRLTRTGWKFVALDNLNE
ncbi:MAG: hypothetical protein QOJ64_3075 [Acidobacteriota bacterium]|jgi:hypothetical protein|nr:hypothetical protein [Acidobacteriota bacterium]